MEAPNVEPPSQSSRRLQYVAPPAPVLNGLPGAVSNVSDVYMPSAGSQVERSHSPARVGRSPSPAPRSQVDAKVVDVEISSVSRNYSSVSAGPADTSTNQVAVKVLAGSQATGCCLYCHRAFVCLRNWCTTLRAVGSVTVIAGIVLIPVSVVMSMRAQDEDKKETRDWTLGIGVAVGLFAILVPTTTYCWYKYKRLQQFRTRQQQIGRRSVAPAMPSPTLGWANS